MTRTADLLDACLIAFAAIDRETDAPEATRRAARVRARDTLQKMLDGGAPLDLPQILELAEAALTCERILAESTAPRPAPRPEGREL